MIYQTRNRKLHFIGKSPESSALFRKRWSGKITSKRWHRSTTSALKTSAGWWNLCRPDRACTACDPPQIRCSEKNTAAEGVKNSQKLLLTWLVEQPQLYRQFQNIFLRRILRKAYMKRWRTGCLRSWSRAISIRLPLSACLRRKRISARRLLCSIRSWSVWKPPAEQEKALHDIVSCGQAKQL